MDDGVYRLCTCHICGPGGVKQSRSTWYNHWRDEGKKSVGDQENHNENSGEVDTDIILEDAEPLQLPHPPSELDSLVRIQANLDSRMIGFVFPTQLRFTMFSWDT